MQGVYRVYRGVYPLYTLQLSLRAYGHKSLFHSLHTWYVVQYAVLDVVQLQYNCMYCMYFSMQYCMQYCMYFSMQYSMQCSSSVRKQAIDGSSLNASCLLDRDPDMLPQQRRAKAGRALKRCWTRDPLAAGDVMIGVLLLSLVLINIDTVVGAQSHRQECKRLYKEHKVKPGTSWGSMSSEQQFHWMDLKCDRFFCVPDKKAGRAVYKCIPIKETTNTSSH